MSRGAFLGALALAFGTLFCLGYFRGATAPIAAVEARGPEDTPPAGRNTRRPRIDPSGQVEKGATTAAPEDVVPIASISYLNRLGLEDLPVANVLRESIQTFFQFAGPSNCMTDDPLRYYTQIRYSYHVRTLPDSRIEVSNAQVEVSEGAPLPARVIHCLQAQIEGRHTIDENLVARTMRARDLDTLPFHEFDDSHTVTLLHRQARNAARARTPPDPP